MMRDDPETGQPWPAMPPLSRARRAGGRQAGFSGFAPDVCLINRYVPGARMSLHQDKDELDFAAPIVSVSLGLPAIFLFGGLKRSDKPRRFRLEHGDIAVWGGPARLVFHGVAPLADGEHALIGRQRINLTFARRVRRRLLPYGRSRRSRNGRWLARIFSRASGTVNHSARSISGIWIMRPLRGGHSMGIWLLRTAPVSSLPSSP